MNQEIEQSQWEQFLKDFSKRNELRSAQIETLGEKIGAQSSGQHLPLAGLSFESKGSEAGDVVITFAGQTTADPRHLTRRIDSVTRILPRENNNGVEDGLEIIGADGTSTILMLEQLQQLPAATA